MVEDQNNNPSYDDVVGGLADMIDDNFMVTEKDVSKPKAEVKEDPKVEEEVKAEEASSDDDDYLADVDADEDTDGDTPEDEAETEEDAKSDDVDDTEVSLKVDGEDITVTMDELKKGYSRQSDYTKKTQELAEQRKALEEETKTLEYLKFQKEHQPKVFELDNLKAQIDEAEKALHFGRTEDGNVLTADEIKATKDNVDDAKRRLAYETEELNKKMVDIKPPRIEELQEKIPNLFSEDEKVRQPVLEQLSGTLKDFGYSEAEINSTNDPRTLLMVQELNELRDLAARVEKAKARRNKKGDVVSKSTKSTSSRNQKSTGNAKNKPTKDIDALAQRAAQGDGSAISEMFEDFV